MHLKSLTIRGFKSFASSTTLNLEPGITAVVGPNGSGKSNVVDAIAWVMGEQGAKSLRGGKMEDVIFAGTADKAPLGRAEVVLTIDNSDGALPIDYTEVTISRTLFRSGGSEYAINGEPARLLDVQELLSDSGIGREMHVIVGQGRLDSILRATPDDRRGFVEEAAGVLKHRKRKEKALRKLDAMSANLTRLQDLTHELRRQLKPLGKQAEVARRAQVIQSDVRDSALRLLADDVVSLQGALDQEEADEAALIARREELTAQLDAARQAEINLETKAQEQANDLAAANELHTRLTALRERYRGLVALANERAAYLHEPAVAGSSGTDPEALIEQAERAAQTAAELADAIAELSQRHEQRQAEVGAAVAAANQARAEHAEFTKAATAHREQVVRLASAAESLTARLATRNEDVNRRRQRLEEMNSVLRECHASKQALPTADDDRGYDVASQEQVVAQAKQAVTQARARRDEAREELETARRQVTEFSSRLEALKLSHRDGSLEVLAGVNQPALGEVVDYVRVDPAWQDAVAAALAFAADADVVAVSDLAAAVRAVQELRSATAGSATLLISDANQPQTSGTGIPAGVCAATSVISQRGDGQQAAAIHQAVHGLLSRTVLVTDISLATGLLRQNPDLTVVSAAGDVVTARVAIGGKDPGEALRLVQEIDRTTAALHAAHPQVEVAAAAVQRCEAAVTEAADAAEQAAAALDQQRAEAARHGAEVAVIDAQIASTTAEIDRLRQLIERGQVEIADDEAELADVSRRHEELVANAPTEPTLTEAELAELDQAVRSAQEQVTQALLELRASEQRRDALVARAAELREQADHEREVRAAALAAAATRRRQAEQAVAVLEVARGAMAELDEAVEQSQQRRETCQALGRELAAELNSVRPRITALGEQIGELTSDVHKDELARAQQRMRVEQLHERALNEYGVGPEELLAEYGPNRLVPPSPVAPGDEQAADAPAAQPYPFDRQQQEKRLKEAQKAMALLGRVNPLALEEFDAMQERYAFLNQQLEDLKGSRKDLLDIIAEVDGRIQQVFAEAYADVAREFEGVFSRLFPGGEGRLVLTEPNDLLTTGIEVEARPAGKKIKRLSLLSGGERSLTAVAFLVALFKARPSPFYIMDEVEAALDDVNLGRLIGLIKELQDSSQLLIITHQKRTMEVADALYGVTMRGGVTTVISQRVRELATAQA